MLPKGTYTEKEGSLLLREGARERKHALFIMHSQYDIETEKSTIAQTP